MASSHGQKVTTDPQSENNPKNENPGIVTSDSLAAENIQGGGSFGANADSRGPMAQPSHSTTTNTADISNATRLDPASDAEARQASEAWSEESQLNAGRGLGKDAGRGPTWNTPEVGGASGVNDARQPTDDNMMPKGRNISEGGFDASAPNASWNTDIGGKKDPGRVALGKFEEDNVPVAGGAGPREGLKKEGQYDVLKDTSA